MIAAVGVTYQHGVYPRVCGGTTSGAFRPMPMRAGLSPRVRGNLRNERPARRQFRSAGLSPRVRGNQTGQHECLCRCIGLSPRVRGNLCPSRAKMGGVSGNGSIPACAGEPSLSRLLESARMWGLSPRVRGNQRNNSPSLMACPSGLSPRVRGNLAIHPLPSIANAVKVYPRVCGGTSSSGDRPHTVGQNGSIPACAGEPMNMMRTKRFRRRSIPACAGEPYPPNHPGNRTVVYPRVCGGTSLRRPRRRSTF